MADLGCYRGQGLYFGQDMDALAVTLVIANGLPEVKGLTPLLLPQGSAKGCTRRI